MFTPVLLRGGVAVLATVALSAASAHAADAPKLLAAGGFVDATSDGKYVLLDDGRVIAVDGSTAAPTVLPPVAGRTPLAIADRAPIVLERGPGGLYVRSAASPEGKLVSLGPDGFAVPWSDGAGAELVQNGTAVIFTTTESGNRILKRDLVAGTTTTLAGPRVALLDASEDGTLITWERQVEAKLRTAGTPLPSDPGVGSGRGVAVGYTLNGKDSYVVAKTKLTQRIVGTPPETGCPVLTEIDRETPRRLEISENAAGKHALLLTTSFVRGGGYPFSAGTTTRLTQTGSQPFSSTDGQQFTSIEQVDPVSGAVGSILINRVQAPLTNRASIVQPSGEREPLLVVGQNGTTDPVGRYRNLLPVQGGATAIYAFTPLEQGGPGAEGTYVRTGFTPGTDATPWLTLPRAIDAPDASVSTVDVDYVVCEGATPTPTPTPAPPVAGTWGDYASYGAGTGWVEIIAAPEGKIAARSATVTLSWYGIPVWSRTVTRSAYVTLPKVNRYLGGFKVTTVVTLKNGARVSDSRALRPTDTR